jgi:FMN phosphatase YigB (HAD superfamily)
LLEDAANQQNVLEERSNHLRLLIRKIIAKEDRLGDLGKKLPKPDRKILEAAANAEIVKEERTLFEKQLKNREKIWRLGITTL